MRHACEPDLLAVSIDFSYGIALLRDVGLREDDCSGLEVRLGAIPARDHRCCLTSEGAVAQLQAELELERQASCHVAAEKAALREHLSGIVSRLRPRLAAGGRDPSDTPIVPPVPLQEIEDAEHIIEATSDYGGSRKTSMDNSCTMSLDAWSSSNALRNMDSAAHLTSAKPRNSLVTDVLKASSFYQNTGRAEQEVTAGQSACAESPTVPITPGKHAESPAYLQASTSKAATRSRIDE